MGNLWSHLWQMAEAVLPQAKEQIGSCVREVSEPALDAAAEHNKEVLDHAAQLGHGLLEDGEARAQRMVEDVDCRLTNQRDELLNRTEHACDRITRRLMVRVVLTGMALVGAAGVATILVVWASSHLK